MPLWMIHELYTALTEANVSPESARSAVEAVEKAIGVHTNGAAKEMYTDKVVPLEKETTGIRFEIRLLTETMHSGFITLEKTLTARIDGLEKSTTIRIDSLEKSTTARIDSLEKRLELHSKLLFAMLALIGGGFISLLAVLLRRG